MNATYRGSHSRVHNSAQPPRAFASPSFFSQSPAAQLGCSCSIISVGKKGGSVRVGVGVSSEREVRFYVLSKLDTAFFRPKEKMPSKAKYKVCF